MTAVAAAVLAASVLALPVSVAVSPTSFTPKPCTSMATPNNAPRPENSGGVTPGLTVSWSTILAPGMA